MVLVDNKNVHIINFSGVILGPRVNKVEDGDWERISKIHKRQIDSMIKDGQIEVIKNGKVSIELIEKTLHKDLLEQWAEKATGKHKTAIEAQLKLLEMPDENEGK
jgi:PBP1b-binding outer membrane lipoprotein LpoB